MIRVFYSGGILHFLTEITSESGLAITGKAKVETDFYTEGTIIELSKSSIVLQFSIRDQDFEQYKDFLKRKSEEKQADILSAATNATVADDLAGSKKEKSDASLKINIK